MPGYPYCCPRSTPVSTCNLCSTPYHNDFLVVLWNFFNTTLYTPCINCSNINASFLVPFDRTTTYGPFNSEECIWLKELSATDFCDYKYLMVILRSPGIIGPYVILSTFNYYSTLDTAGHFISAWFGTDYSNKCKEWNPYSFDYRSYRAVTDTNIRCVYNFASSNAASTDHYKLCDIYATTIMST